MCRSIARLFVAGIAAAGLFIIAGTTTAGAATASHYAQPGLTVLHLREVDSHRTAGYIITRLKNEGTNRCLDSNYNGNVYALPCNGGNYQNWISPDGTGVWYDAQTGLCLDSNWGDQVYTLGCNGGNFQNWYNGLAPVMEDAQTGLYLDTNNHGNVYTWPLDGHASQYWIQAGLP